MNRARVLAGFGAVAVLVAALPATVGASTVVTTSHGTWTAYPGQSTSYQASVQQPINADGSSNFKANGKTVIPVKFALAQGTGAFVFQSIFSNNPTVTSDDFSFLEFDPTTPPTLAQVTSLVADYAFTTGTCQVGSLRWTLYLQDGAAVRNLDVHYQPGENGIGDQFCQTATSGANRADLTSVDPYVVIQQFNHAPYAFSSSYNVTYSEAVSQLGTLPVLGMNLALDSGYAAGGDQIVALSSASVGVGGASPYTEKFTPAASTPTTSVCPTQQARISITKTDGTPTGDVNEPLTIQPQDNNGIFRIVDCKYMYNLATSSLSGAGTYTVKATIGSTTFTVGTFDLK
jgi:hypothetical protein